MTDKYLKALQEQLPSHEMQALLNPDPLLCMAIKTKDHGYIYANNNHLKLMGFSGLSGILHKTDADLYADQNAIKVYQQDDEYIYSTDKSIHIEGNINPINHNNLNKTMIGAMHPLHIDASRPDAVLVITKPKNKMITLSIEHLLKTESQELQTNLTHRSYKIKYNQLNISLARMELLCLAELLKGKSATDISKELSIKQLTVESYLSNLKNKCGVGKKSELIHFFNCNNLLENIVV